MLVFCLLTATGLQLIETYEVDTTAAAHFTAQLFLDGLHPYRDFDLLAASTFFNVPEVFRTTLTDGSYMRPMPYPAGSFLTLTPFIALGLPDVRPVYALFHLGLALLLFWLAPRSLKLAALALALGVHAISFSSIGQGYSEPMIILLLAVAWLLLGRAPLGGIALGLAIAVKQNAWFFFPFYIMALYFRHGPKGALTGGRWAVGVFLAMNVPFLWDFPQAWVHVALPYLVFPQGVMGFGPSQLGAALWPDGPVSAVFTLLEAIAGISALAAYWRWGRKTPELGLILPWVPLWFNWIATYNYYYLLPFLTAVGILVSRRESQQQASSLPTGP